MAEQLPYIEFDRRPVRKNDPAGVEYFEDTDYVRITQPGGKDVAEKVAKDYIAQCEMHVKNKRMSAEALRQIKAAFSDFQQGNNPNFEGTPVEALGLAKGQVSMLHHLKIRSVEDLAAVNDEALQRMGMGARNMKRKAEAYILARPQVEVETKLAASEQKVTSLTAAVERLNMQVSQLLAINKGLGGADGQSQMPQWQTRTPGAQADVGEAVEDAILGDFQEAAKDAPESALVGV